MSVTQPDIDALWDDVYNARHELLHAALICCSDDMESVPSAERMRDEYVTQSLILDDHLYKCTLKLASALARLVSARAEE